MRGTDIHLNQPVSPLCFFCQPSSPSSLSGKYWQLDETMWKGQTQGEVEQNWEPMTWGEIRSLCDFLVWRTFSYCYSRPLDTSSGPWTRGSWKDTLRSQLLVCGVNNAWGKEHLTGDIWQRWPGSQEVIWWHLLLEYIKVFLWPSISDHLGHSHSCRSVCLQPRNARISLLAGHKRISDSCSGLIIEL